MGRGFNKILVISFRRAIRHERKWYEEIDLSDIPSLDEAFFRNAILWPGPKKQITLRIDPDVLDFFRKRGRGYQTMINAVLRRYVEAHARRSFPSGRVKS
jgi:uncharacterized protein (DUF4415 family)